MKLTEEQKIFAEQNHNLILSFLHSKGLPIWGSDPDNCQDWYGIAAIGYCKAVATYDPSKSKFSTLAYRCMNTAVWMCYREMNAVSRIPEWAQFYYDDTFNTKDGKDGTEFAFLETIPSANSLEDEILTAISFDDALNKFSDSHKEIVKYAMLGYKQREIASITNISQAQVSRVLNKFKSMVA